MSVDAFEIEAGEFAFTAHAAGPPDGRMVLLLHGFPQSSYEWRHQMAALAAAGYRAVAFDQRGYSPKARPEGVESYRMEHLVGDVLAVADELGAHRLDVVGHDWGGAVAWLVAAHYPQRVRTLTAVSTPHPAAFAAAVAGGDPDQLARSAYIEMLRKEGAAEEALLAGDGAGLQGVLVAAGYPEPEKTGEYVRLLSEPGALTGALNWYRAVSVTEAAARSAGALKVEVPTLYVWGDADPALGRMAAEGSAAFVEGPYHFEEMAGVGHWIPEEVPDDLNRLLLEHLAAHG
ncbi:MAG TPA: alpha/beta hydrolase [Acidimicrobiales bacterium]|nr:alpha/beta hydrolase [Acidimicrobiales bacterium]